MVFLSLHRTPRMPDINEENFFFVEEFQPKNAKREKQKNQHFVTPKEIMNLGYNYEWTQTSR
jgi:hypothetical protein